MMTYHVIEVLYTIVTSVTNRSPVLLRNNSNEKKAMKTLVCGSFAFRFLYSTASMFVPDIYDTDIGKSEKTRVAGKVIAGKT